MPFCSSCGTDVGAGVKFCPKCGTASDGSAAGPQAGAPPSAVAAPAAGAIPNENMMGALSYFVLPAILFLVVEPYNRSSFIRYHSFQAIFYAVAAFVVNIVASVFWVIPFIGWLIAMVVYFAIVAVWLLLAFKAFSGERFKLPVIGDLAEKQASAG